MLGILFIFSISFVEKLFFNIVNKSQNSNTIFMYKSIFTAFFLAVMAYFLGGFINFFVDPIFYLLLAMELLVVLKSKYVFEIFHSRFVYISFALFSSIYLMPLFSYFLKDLFGFEDNLSFIFTDLSDLVIFSSSLFILNVLYFYNKLKKADPLTIPEGFLLLIFAPIMTTTLYLAVNMIQKYEPNSLYSIVVLTHFFVFLFVALKKKERFTITKNELIVIPSHVVTLLLSFAGAKFLAVEFFTIFKRLGSVYSGYFFDSKNNKNYKVDSFELIVVVTITIMVFGVYFFN